MGSVNMKSLAKAPSLSPFTTLQEVNALLKQFGQMREMMRSPHKMKNMMKAMSGGADSLDQLGDMKRGFGNIGGKRR